MSAEQPQPTAAHHTITTARRPDHIRLSALVRSQFTRFIVHASSQFGRGPPKRGHFSAILAGFSIDFAYALSLGYHKEEYYLLIHADGVEMLWCTLTTSRAQPHELIQEFANYSGIQVRSINLITSNYGPKLRSLYRALL